MVVERWVAKRGHTPPVPLTQQSLRVSVKQTADSGRCGRMASSGCWRPTRSCGRCARLSALMASRCTTQPTGRPASRCRRVACLHPSLRVQIQRSVVNIEWQKQACVAMQAGRLSASPIPLHYNAEVGSQYYLPKADLHVAAGRSPTCLYLCLPVSSCWTSARWCARSVKDPRRTCHDSAGACKGVRGALGAALQHGKTQWQAACKARKGPLSLLWHRPAQGCSAHEHERGQQHITKPLSLLRRRLARGRGCSGWSAAPLH